MPMLRVLLAKVQGMFSERRAGSEFDEEVEEHIRLLIDRFIQQGMSPDDATRAALRQFGNAGLVRQSNREGRLLIWMVNLNRDLRYALRQLWANPGFTTVMVLTLALSIGANSAIFSVIESVLLKSLPYPNAQQLMKIFLSNQEFPVFPLNPWDFRDFRERNKSFEAMAAYTRGDMQLAGSGDPVRLNGFQVTAGYFRVLGLHPALGREFDFNEEISGNGQEVVLSDRVWRDQFGAARDILGRKITLNAQAYTVVGVMPAGTEHPGNGYHAVAYGESVDVWRPFSFTGNSAQRGSHFVEAIGRLKAGVTAEQARAEMNSLMAQMAREHEGDRGWQVLVIPLYTEIVGASRRMLLVLLGAVGMVLLIACANAANLLMVRASARQREITVRLALGASRPRLVRQLLTETLLLSLLGGGVGLALAWVGVKGLVTLLPADFPRAHEIQISLPVFAFTLLVCVATGILFGLAPAMQASRSDPKTGLQQGGRSSIGSGERSRLRNALVISEVGLACVLLVGAGLMLHSLLNLLHLDPGFKQAHVLTANLSLPQARYKSDKAMSQFCARLMEELNTIPGVESVGAGSDLPWTGYDENTSFNIEGKTPPPHKDFHARYHMATPDYFRALGIPLLSGRYFRDSDNQDAAKAIVINRATAQAYWPGEDVVGKRITFEDNPKDKDWITIVGVVGDVKDKPDSAGAAPAFWMPEYQQSNPDMSLVVRSEGNPQLLADAVRAKVRQLDPSLAVADVRLMDQIVDTSVATPRIAFVLVGLFAGLAMVLAAIGTYGVIAYSVSRRTAEFGLRMALGAQRGDVLRLVLAQAARLVVGGTLLGIVLALALGRVLKSLIYDVSPTDPVTFGVVGLMVIAVAAVACYIPARKATQASPMNALRAE